MTEPRRWPPPITIEDVERLKTLHRKLVPTQWEWIEKHQADVMRELSRSLVQNASYFLDLAEKDLERGYWHQGRLIE